MDRVSNSVEHKFELPERPSRYLRSIRGPKRHVVPNRVQGVEWEQEPDGLGGVVEVATLFLTGAECRFTCSMCDLWQYTLSEPGPTPRAVLVEQIRTALPQVLGRVPKVRWLKLYNASSFFDPFNVPVEDLPEIARLCEPFERVIVENHPRLIRSDSIARNVVDFSHQIAGILEIALGLESTHPEAMRLLNKSMDLEDFKAACSYLAQHEIDIRSFVLLQPPGIPAEESVQAAVDAAQFALSHGARHVTVIPTRSSGGWMETIQSLGKWVPPNALALERTLQELLKTGSMEIAIFVENSPSNPVVTADTWDWTTIAGCCELCRAPRLDRLIAMNRLQQILPDIPCEHCTN